MDELPQKSVAVYVLVREWLQPFELVLPTEQLIVAVEHISVAVAVPQPGIVPGLQPRFGPGGQDVNTGASVSSIHVKVCVQVAELLHPSVAV